MKIIHKNNQSGFGIVELLVIIMLVALITGAGWFAYSRQKQVSHKSPTTPIQENKNQIIDKTAELTKYSDPQLGVAFSYPKDWVMVKCDDKPKTIYLGSDNRGVGKNEGKSILCGGGSDFPPQMRLELTSKDFKPSGEGSLENLTIAGHPASKYTYLSDGTVFYPNGLETTTYFIKGEEGILVATYNKWPKDEGNYDTSDESKAKFTQLVESSLQLVKFF